MQTFSEPNSLSTLVALTKPLLTDNSSKTPITPPVINIDPDIPPGFGALAAAVFRQANSVTEGTLSRIPAETTQRPTFRNVYKMFYVRQSPACRNKRQIRPPDSFGNRAYRQQPGFNDLDATVDGGWVNGFVLTEASAGPRNL